jgi:uncharacterized protein (DUF983 family)
MEKQACLQRRDILPRSPKGSIMSGVTNEGYRPVDLAESPGKRFAQCLGRSATRSCPYCGGGGIFNGWFNLKERCPNCNVLYEPEDGYLLGAYVINIGLVAVIAIASVISLMVWSDLTTLQIQMIGAGLAIGLPIFFYPYTLLLWITLDLTIHPPGDFSGRHRR